MKKKMDERSGLSDDLLFRWKGDWFAIESAGVVLHQCDGCKVKAAGKCCAFVESVCRQWVPSWARLKPSRAPAARRRKPCARG